MSVFRRRAESWCRILCVVPCEEEEEEEEEEEPAIVT